MVESEADEIVAFLDTVELTFLVRGRKSEQQSAGHQIRNLKRIFLRWSSVAQPKLLQWLVQREHHLKLVSKTSLCIQSECTL